MEKDNRSVDEIVKDLEILDCPVCHGAPIVEEEDGWCCYVACMECGAHTGESSYEDAGDKATAVKRAVSRWNSGKVIQHQPGE